MICVFLYLFCEYDWLTARTELNWTCVSTDEEMQRSSPEFPCALAVGCVGRFTMKAGNE